MTQLSLNYDTRPDPSVQRSRRSDESADAWATAKRSAGQTVRQIYRLIEVLGPLTAKQIAVELGKPLNAISGRCAEMTTPEPRGFGLLYKQMNPETGKTKRINGAAVLAIAKPWKDGK